MIRSGICPLTWTGGSTALEGRWMWLVVVTQMTYWRAHLVMFYRARGVDNKESDWFFR